MSLLTDVQAAAATFTATVDDLVVQEGLLEDVITGPSGGADSLVNVGPRTLKTVARTLLETEATRPFAVRGAWNSGTTYAALDAVFYIDTTYVSMADGNLNNAPASSPLFWMKLVSVLAQAAQLTPYDFGAVGDGVTHDDVAINAWLNSGSAILDVPVGTFLMNDGWTYGQIPDSVREIRGSGGTFTLDPAAASFSTVFWTNTFGGDSLDIHGLTYIGKADAEAFGGSSFITPTGTNTGPIRIYDNWFKTTGDFGVQILGDFHGRIENNRFDEVKRSAVYMSVASTKGWWFANNKVKMKSDANYIGVTGLGLSHIIGNDFQDGPATGGFAIFLGGSSRGSTIIGNTISNWGFDGIEIQTAAGDIIESPIIANNVIGNPSPSPSVEVGIGLSPNGAGSKIRGAIVIGNTILRTGGAGILVGFVTADGVEYCLIASNMILDPNQGSNAGAGGAGIFISNTKKNLIRDNYIVSTDGKMTYGVSDTTSGTTDNWIFNNRVVGAASGRYLVTSAKTLTSELGALPSGNLTDLPNPATVGLGFQAICLDATSTTRNANPTGGGGNIVKVWGNGTTYQID